MGLGLGLAPGAQLIERVQVGVQVVAVVGVVWVALRPLRRGWRRTLSGGASAFRLGLVVDTVDAHDLVRVRVGVGVRVRVGIRVGVRARDGVRAGVRAGA